MPWLRKWLSVLFSLSWWLPLSGLHPLLYSRCQGVACLYVRAYDGPREKVSRSHSFSGPRLLILPLVRCLLFFPP